MNRPASVGKARKPWSPDSAEPHVVVVCVCAFEVGPREDPARGRLVVLRGANQASHGRVNPVGAHHEGSAQFVGLRLHSGDTAALFDQARDRRLRPDLRTRRGGCLDENRVERYPPRAQHWRPHQLGEVAELDTGIVEGDGSRSIAGVTCNSAPSTPRRPRIFTPEGCTPCVEAVSLGNRARSTTQTLIRARASRIASGEPAHRAPTTITSNRSAITLPLVRPRYYTGRVPNTHH